MNGPKSASAAPFTATPSEKDQKQAPASTTSPNAPTGGPAAAAGGAAAPPFAVATTAPPDAKASATPSCVPLNAFCASYKKTFNPASGPGAPFAQKQRIDKWVEAFPTLLNEALDYLSAFRLEDAQANKDLNATLVGLNPDNGWAQQIKQFKIFVHWKRDEYDNKKSAAAQSATAESTSQLPKNPEPPRPKRASDPTEDEAAADTSLSRDAYQPAFQTLETVIGGVTGALDQARGKAHENSVRYACAFFLVKLLPVYFIKARNIQAMVKMLTDWLNTSDDAFVGRICPPGVDYPVNPEGEPRNPYWDCDRGFDFMKRRRDEKWCFVFTVNPDAQIGTQASNDAGAKDDAEAQRKARAQRADPLKDEITKLSNDYIPK